MEWVIPPVTASSFHLNEEGAVCQEQCDEGYQAAYGSRSVFDFWDHIEPLSERIPTTVGLFIASMRPLSVKPLFSLLATSPNPFLWLIELAAS